MEWQLIKVDKTEWKQDESGYYTLINWIDANTVRLDIMDKNDMPVVSFQGEADDVRKYMMQHFGYLGKNWPLFSYEHAAYIGAELARAELLKSDYVQD